VDGRRVAALLAGVLAGVAVAGVLVRSRAPHAAPASDVLLPADARVLDAPRGGPDAPPSALPRSLRGTEIDGALEVGPDGHFRPTRAALAFFDYFLAASGEESDAALRARIEAEISRRLPPTAAAEARAFLERYLGYRAAARELAESDPGPIDLERRLQRLRELRRAWFGPELAETLFGQEEDVARIALERRRVEQDPSLSPDQRARQLAALEAKLPEPEREARAQAVAPLQVEREVEALRSAGGSEADVWAARAQAFGPEAADRLAALDAARADFARRLAEYRAARDAVQADPSLSPQERTQAVERLRAEHFRPDELAHVRALDGLSPTPATGP
jgi:lipase chaperone LimK